MRALQRLGWLRAVAEDGDLHSAAYRVAAYIADAFDERAGVFRYGTATIARDLGAARSSVQAGLYSLARRGWLVVVGEPSKGRAATAYKLMLNGSTDRESGQSTDRKDGRLDDEPTVNQGGCSLQPTGQPTGNPGTILTILTPTTADTDSPSFTLKDGKSWHPTAEAIRRLEVAFPNVDVPATLKIAASWCEANPAKRKTAAGMPRFLHGWCARERSGRPKPPDTTAETYATPAGEPRGFTLEEAQAILGSDE